MEGEKFSLVELKEMLRQLGLPREGNKVELVKQLWKYSPDGSWKDVVRKAREIEESEEEYTQTEETVGNEDR